jgi:sugar/nucleoside kinase (ribokinase family)
METNLSIVVIGQLTLDDVVRFDQPVLLDSPGGCGLYALAGICLWDTGSLGFVTRRGNDYDLDPIFNKIGDRLNLQGIHQIEKPSIHIWNMFDRIGNRYFVMQRWGSNNDVMGIYPEDIPSGFNSAHSFLVDAFPLEYQSRVIQALPVDSIIAVDPHYQGIYPQFQDTWNELLKKIMIFLPSEEEFIRFFSLEAQESLSEYIPYLKEISSRGPQIVGVKLGARGVIVYDRAAESIWHIPAYPVKEIIDVTGCGDAFCGGFMSNFVQDKDAYNSAVHGIISASFNLEQYGVLHNFSIDKQRVINRFNEYNATLNRDRQKLI